MLKLQLNIGILLCAWIAFAAASAHGAVVLSEDFSGGAGALNGTTTDVGGATWETGSAFHADGSVDSIVSGSPTGQAAFVPFSVQPGNFYIATAIVTNTYSDWLAFGFLPGSPPGGDWTAQASNVRHTGNGAYAWMLTRNHGSNNDQEAFNGPNTSNSAFGGDIVNPNAPVTLRIELDTTGGTWLAEYFLNGVSQGQFALAGGAAGSIGGIGFSRDWHSSGGTSATISSLVVESLLDRTISGTILADGTTPFQGVSVNATGTGGSDVTDSSGNYAIVVPNGWSGDIVPTAVGELAYPAARSYANVIGDVSGQAFDMCSDVDPSACENGVPPEGDVVSETVVSTDGWADNSINASNFRQNSITSHGGWQFIAFVDTQERVVLGKRLLGASTWTLQVTPYSVDGTDAHNGATIGVDGDGYLHVSWGHHGDPLNYARSTAPLGLVLTGTLSMIGSLESDVTYPQFYNLPDGRLLFFYRDGGSGNGNMVLNRWDPLTTTWTRLHTTLLDGENTRNAYIQAAVDVNGRVHVSWVWRETGDVVTNHDMGYARSDDAGATWQRTDGSTYSVPITAATSEYAALIAQGSELINQTGMAGDGNGNPYIATYFRAPGGAAPQFWVLHHDGISWTRHQVGTRTLDFTLGGGGTQSIPISRPQVMVTHTYGPVVHVIFRDDERGAKVTLATATDLFAESWQVRDLTVDSVNKWEPTFDRAAWKASEELYINVQEVDQVDDEGLAALPPTPVRVLLRSTPAAVPGLSAAPATWALVASAFSAAAMWRGRRKR